MPRDLRLLPPVEGRRQRIAPPAASDDDDDSRRNRDDANDERFARGKEKRDTQPNPRAVSAAAAAAAAQATASQDDGVTMEAHVRSELKFYFDGALRQNGRVIAEERPIGIGVYAGEYKSPFTRKACIFVKYATNNIAEIQAITEAVSCAIHEVKAANRHEVPVDSISFFGDSLHVITTCKSGRLETYTGGKVARSNAPNALLWKTLADEIAVLRGLVSESCGIFFEWIPRLYNQEADELANAALDSREVNYKIHSPTSVADLSPERALMALKASLHRRVRAPRTLTFVLAQLWRDFLNSILQAPNPNMRRILFWLAPALLEIGAQRVNGRSSFKKARAHLEGLFIPSYLASCIEQIINRCENRTDIRAEQGPGDAAEEAEAADHRFHTLVKRGLHLKAVDESNITIADESFDTATKLNSLFPTAELPTAIEHSDRPTRVEWNDIRDAFQKLKRGAAPSFSGWTRELLAPLILSMPVEASNRMTLEQIFTDLLNVRDITATEQRLMADGLLIPFSYSDKPGKIRPIQVREAFSKMCWRIALDEAINKDDTFSETAQCCFRRGASTSALMVIQEAFQHFPVITTDAKNAFNCISRKAAMEHIAEHAERYRKALPLINLLYCSKTWARRHLRDGTAQEFAVTTGTNQGCVSGIWFYVLASTPALAGLTGAVAIVDDVVFCGPSAMKDFTKYSECCAEIGLDVTSGMKTKLYATPDQFERANELLMPVNNYFLSDECDENGNYLPNEKVIEVTSSFSKFGGMVHHRSYAPDDMMLSQLTNGVLSKVLKRCNCILKRTSAPLQDRLQVLHHLSFAYQFYARSLLIPDSVFQTVMETIDGLHTATWQLLTGIEIADSTYVHLHTPIEDRGFGIVPYQCIGLHLRHLAAIQAEPTVNYFKDVKLLAKGIEVSYESPNNLAQGNSIGNAWRFVSAKLQKVKNRNKAFPWLSVQPISQILTLSDEETLFYARYLTRTLPRSSEQRCPQGVDLSALSSEEFFQHFNTCKSCANAGVRHRHDLVASMLVTTLRHHAITAYYEPTSFKMYDSNGSVDNQLRPDAHILAPNCLVDVAICFDPDSSKATALTTRVREKNNKYKHTLRKLPGTSFVPFVLNTYGNLASEALDGIHSWKHLSANKGLFLSDISSNVIMTLIKGIFRHYQAFLLATGATSDAATLLKGASHFPTTKGGEIMYDTSKKLESIFEQKVSQLKKQVTESALGC